MSLTPTGGIHVVDRTDHLATHIRRAVELSFPLYTYAEVKRILRCEYHRLVVELRATKSWNEISLLSGMTRAGLNKLGDEVTPLVSHNGLRVLLAILQESGAAGLTLPRLASAYYERCPDLEEGPSFEEALRALVDSGDVVATGGRYATAAVTHRHDAELAGGIEDSVGRIAEAVRDQDGKGVAQLHRISFRAPSDPDAQREVLLAMKQAVLEVAVQTEASIEGEGQWMTIVLGGARELL